MSDSSEQFVFLSGLVLGSVFTRKQGRGGWTSALRDMLRRTGRLWRTHMLALAGFGAMLLLVNLALPGEADAYGWEFLTRDPLRAAVAAAALAYQPVFLDALPVLIWSMLVLPLFAWTAARVGAWALLPVGAAVGHGAGGAAVRPGPFRRHAVRLRPLRVAGAVHARRLGGTAQAVEGPSRPRTAMDAGRATAVAGTGGAAFVAGVLRRAVPVLGRDAGLAVLAGLGAPWLDPALILCGAALLMAWARILNRARP